MNKILTLLKAFLAFYKIRKLQKDYPNYLIFVATAGLGDICYALAYLDALKNKRKKKVLMVASPYSKELVSYYAGIDNYYILSQIEFNCFKGLSCTGIGQSIFNNKNNRSDVYTCDAWSFYPFRLMNLKGVDFFQIIQVVNYELIEENLSKTYPIVPNCDLDKYGIYDWSKVIIINPHSNFKNIGGDIFEEITSILISKGYNVYTNVSTVYADVLEGTRPLVCNLQELYNIAKKARLFISVRSGILDFSINCGGRFMVIYKNEEDGLFKKAYTLYDWNSQSDIIEFESNQVPEIIDFVSSL